jgi:large subunit ribosomal protein L19
MSAPNAVIQEIEKQFLRDQPLPSFRPGDTVKVWVKIREGDKTRLQAFEGVCIKRSGRGLRGSFTVRKISYGVGVERIFPFVSPNVAKVEVVGRGRVRRSRLYYLRGRTGKAARIRERAWDRKLAKLGQRLGAAEAEAAAEAAADDAAVADPAGVETGPTE